MLEVLNVVLDVLGILAIVCLGAFVVVLIGDLILSTFDGHEGVFFHKSKNVGPTHTYNPAPFKEEEPPQKALQQQPTVIPYYQEVEQREREALENEKQPEVVSAVDFDKAAEEQKMLQSRGMIKEPARRPAPASEPVRRPQPVFSEVEDEEDDNELADAIKETTQIALNQIALESELKKQQAELDRNRREEEEAKRRVEEERRVAEEARRAAEEERRRAEEARIAAEEEAKRIAEEARIAAGEEARRRDEEARRARQQKAQAAKAQKEDSSVKQLKRLREDIFTLRRSAFMDLQEVKDVDYANEMKQTKREYNRAMKEKLRELDELKLTHEQLDREKQELLKYKEVALRRESELERVEKENAELQKYKQAAKARALELDRIAVENAALKKYKRAAEQNAGELDRIAQEKAQLAKEVEELKQITESAGKKPYYTKEYYVKKLDSLNAELKELEKELRANKREFVPLQRIKKSYERDQEKLRRKEAIVAKQKVAIYGVKSSANIDPKRKEKLDEDVKQLNELKESVFHCEQVLKQNKDRYPVLEKANKLLTKTYDRLMADIENVKTAIAWYDENEGK